MEVGDSTPTHPHPYKNGIRWKKRQFRSVVDWPTIMPQPTGSKMYEEHAEQRKNNGKEERKERKNKKNKSIGRT